MYYTIYKTTNILNNKYYIGKHQTKNLDDGYMGSGKYLKRAITKYGIENFKKEILHIFDNEEEMNAKEKELVVICEQSYNLCDGGNGGFSYINRTGKNLRTGTIVTDVVKQKISKTKKGVPSGKLGSKCNRSDEEKQRRSTSLSMALTGKIKSEEHKQHISESIKRKWNEKKKIYLTIT